MAIEILEKGTPPAARTYTARCRKCTSLLRFAQSDAEYQHDQRDGDFLAIECPVCRAALTVYASQFDRSPSTGA